MSLPAATVLNRGGIAFACAILCACSIMSSPSSSEEGADAGSTEESTTLPESAGPTAKPPAPSSGKGGDDKKPNDAGAGDADKSDAEPDGAVEVPANDAGPAPGKAGYGEACAAHGDCATGLCLEFDGELRCTQTCNDDDECHNGDDCDDDVKVCEID